VTEITAFGKQAVALSMNFTQINLLAEAEGSTPRKSKPSVGNNTRRVLILIASYYFPKIHFYGRL
jgi:hypothetical protein